MNPSDFKTYSDVAIAFLRQRSVTQRKSTLKANTTHLNAFGLWLKDKGYADISTQGISKYMVEEFSCHLADKVEGRGLDKGTCENYKKSLSLVFGFALERDMIEELPMVLFRLPQKGKDCSAELIPDAKISPLLQDIKEHDFQLFVACMTEFACYLRPRTELRLRKVKDFDLKQGIVSVPSDEAKVGKARILTMPRYLIEIYKEYGMESADPESYVFGANHSFYHIPISENMISYRFNIFRDAHGLSKGIKFYSFKYSGSKAFLKVGDVTELMRALGHANLSATQRYICKNLGIVNTNYQKNAINPLSIGIAP